MTEKGKLSKLIQRERLCSFLPFLAVATTAALGRCPAEFAPAAELSSAEPGLAGFLPVVELVLGEKLRISFFLPCFELHHQS